MTSVPLSLHSSPHCVLLPIICPATTRAKNITNKPRINEDPKDAMLREFQEEIQRLKAALMVGVSPRHNDTHCCGTAGSTGKILFCLLTVCVLGFATGSPVA